MFSGTPSATSTFTVTYQATDNDNDVATRSIEFTVSDPPQTDPATRMDSTSDISSFFTTASNFNLEVGTWSALSSGTTPTVLTGPGTNTSGAYVYSETSGATSDQSGANSITSNSALTAKTGTMDSWTGLRRILSLRLAIAGAAWVDDGEGFEIQGRASSSDSWERIRLIHGWTYAGTAYTAGTTITDSESASLNCVQDGGWVDFETVIPDNFTQLRLRSSVVHNTSEIDRHDVGMWQIEFRDGVDTVPVRPDAPTWDSTNERLEWEEPGNDGGESVTSYDLRYRQTSATNWTYVYDVTSTSYTLTGLTSGVEYEAQVRATNSVGDSPYSTSLTFSMSGVPAIPATPTLTQEGNTSIVVTWVTPSGTPDSYDLRYRESGTSAWTDIADRTTTTYTITGLTNGNTYEVQVRATNSEGDSNYSSSATLRLNASPSVSINNSATTIGDSDVISLTATASDGDGTISSYAWTASPNVGTFTNAAVKDATWTGPAVGILEQTVTLTLTVTDNDGATASDNVVMTVIAAPDLAVSLPATTNFTIYTNRFFYYQLPDAMGGNMPLTYSHTITGTLPTGMSYSTTNRLLSGTPSATGSFTLNYTVTDLDGDSVTRNIVFTVSNPPATDPATRLDSTTDLDTFFTPAATYGTESGAWEIDSGGSTATGQTGPGTNSSGPYAHVEASGAGSGQTATNSIISNSLLTVKSGTMTNWTGLGRVLYFRMVLAANGFEDGREGFQIQGRASSTDSWKKCG